MGDRQPHGGAASGSERVGRSPMIVTVVPAGLRPRPVKIRHSFMSISATNYGPEPVALEVYVRRLGEPEIAAAIEEARARSAELESLSASDRADLGRAIASELADPGVKVESERDLKMAIDAAMRAKPEFTSLSAEAHAAILVGLFGRLPKEERDVALPILAMQSAATLGRRTIVASWALVGVTAALVFATIALIVVTAIHH
jgi:hypothetical protein